MIVVIIVVCLQSSARYFSANGIKVYLFESLRPTPEMSFAIRALGCQSGIILTASHNPKEYNGYKAYWNDGAQMISPHDKNTIAEVNRIRSIADIKFKGNPALIEMIGEEVDKLFLDKIKTLSLSPDAIERHKDMKIVYTPIHGTGVKLVPASLKNFGFTNIIHVPEQDVVSGDFSDSSFSKSRRNRQPWIWLYVKVSKWMPILLWLQILMPIVLV